MRPEAEILRDIFRVSSQMIMRDFGSMLKQKNSLNKTKSAESLKTQIFQTISEKLEHETRSKVGLKENDCIKNGWVINPIDGINNFIACTPLFATTATLFSNSLPIISGISIPYMRETIITCKGYGIQMFQFTENGLLKVSNTNTIQLAQISSNIGLGINLFCNSIAYTYTAIGRFDAFILNLNNREKSEAELFIAEGCGECSSIDNCLIGSNKQIHQDVVKLYHPPSVNS